MKPSVCTCLFALLFPVLANAADPIPTQEREDRIDGARKIVRQLATELSSELRTAMKEEGPEAAIRVCRDRAPAIKSRLSRETGWRITRVGTRVRNPLLGMPDAHESEVLSHFQEELDQGADLQNLEHTRIQKAGDARYLRYTKAISVKPQCMGCHGPEENQPEAIRKALETQYPADQATGYKPGDLRGAFSIIQDLSRPYREP
ncbi:Tll0287-like domain-containing protein [Vreelandella utahensis]|uniref:Tll0287-like domain-containing protein n=1 Tax=Vreelandella halophila TaxID=86177 RepID=UPI00098680E4|nr:DUF3365 domain-containing protein [Halomonas utahensis]